MGSIKHAKTSPVPNPLGDTRRVGGGDWNSEHVIDLDVSDIDGLEARLIPVDQVEQFRDDALAFRNEAAGSASDAAASAAEAAATVGALAAPGGAELVGTPEGTVQEALDGRLTKTEAAAADGAAKLGGQQAGAGATTFTAQKKFRELKVADEYATLQNAAADRVAATTKFAVPLGTTTLSGALNLIGYHHVSGAGDGSIVKLNAGAGIVYQANTGVFDDHPHRMLRDFRVTGDGTFQAYPLTQNGTTTNYSQLVHGSYGRQEGMTWELGAVGAKVTGYTHHHMRNYYRANKIGLWLNDVTSHREEGSYFRYNSEAALLLTGSIQNITVAGGAIEGNVGARGLWVKDLTASNVTVTLDDVYFESNGNLATGVPSVDVVDADNISVIASAGSYWSNVLSGVTTGVYQWGRRVSFRGSVLGGLHYAKEMELTGGVQTAAGFNTRPTAADSIAQGLVEPVLMKKYEVGNIFGTFGPVFAVRPSGRPTKKFLTPNLATLAYPHVLSKSAAVVTSSDSAPDYGDGPWTKVQFDTPAGDYNNNYAQLEYVADASSLFPYKVMTVLVKPDADLDIGFISSGTAQQMGAFFRLKAGVTYRLLLSVTRSAAGDMRLRMFPLAANQPAFSIFPVYTAKFATMRELASFMGQIVDGVV